MNAKLQGAKGVSAEPGLSKLQTEFVLKSRDWREAFCLKARGSEEKEHHV